MIDEEWDLPMDRMPSEEAMEALEQALDRIAAWEDGDQLERIRLAIRIVPANYRNELMRHFG